MLKDISFYKSYMCECECAWVADTNKCWFCGQEDNHTVVALSQTNPKIMYLDTYNINPFMMIGDENIGI